MTSATEILRVENLTLSIGARARYTRVLEDVSFTVRDGERWGIAGESGAGKSMTCKAIAALLPSGSAHMTGRILYRLEDGSWTDLLDMPRKSRLSFTSQRVAVIFQDSINALNPYERVGLQWAETIELHHPDMRKGDLEAHMLERMETFGIQGGASTLLKYPHQLSGGMRQRTAIAMALESRASILIADEPTTSLDAITQRSTIDYIDRICRESGKTLLYISHNLGIVQALCDHVIIMKDGRIVEQGEADDVFFRGRDPYTKKIVHETLKIMGKGQSGFEIEEPAGKEARTQGW